MSRLLYLFEVYTYDFLFDVLFDFNRAVESEFIHKNFTFVKFLKNSQQQQKQIPQRQQAFNIHKTKLVEKEQLTELIRMYLCMSKLK